MAQGGALLLLVILAIAAVSSDDKQISTHPPPPPPPPHGSSPPPPPNGSSPPPPPPPHGSSPPPPPNGSSPPPPPPPPPQNSTTPTPVKSESIITPVTISPIDIARSLRVKNWLNPKEVLLEEIRSLDEESTDAKIQQALVKAMKVDDKSAELTGVADAMDYKTLMNLLTSSKSEALATPEKTALEELMQDEEGNYDDIVLTVDNPTRNYDKIIDSEEVLFDPRCPLECKCAVERYPIITARCTKLNSKQSFGPDFAHLKIENAADIVLGPHALQSMGLSHLQSLAFIDTRISLADRTAFDNVQDLFSVNLTRNGLLEIHPDTFQNNSQLDLLTVSGNPLQFSQGRPYAKYFLDAPSVTNLDLSNNALPQLFPNSFVKMPRLVYLSLRGNKLSALDRAIFNTLDQLQEVDLSHNQLNGIPANLFAENEYLEILRIAGNNLSTLATITVPRLDFLDASKNRIKIIAKDDLAGLAELEKLDLKSNGLKRIHQHAFVNLVDLTFLDISDNKMTTLTEHHLRTNSRLEIILMNDNPGLETLPVFKSQDGTFRTIRFECADCGLLYLETGTFDAMPAMTRLNLARNRLSRFPNELLGHMSALRELDLSDNLFNTLEVAMFRGARSLTKLNLAGNPLVTLQVSPFLLTPSLARLDVSRCALDRIWSDTVLPLESLRFLSVRGNRIERINVEDLQTTPKLSGLDISFNPLDCDEEFNDSIQWLTEHGVTTTDTLRYMSNYRDVDDYSEAVGLKQWKDLAKVVCDSIEDGSVFESPSNESSAEEDPEPLPIDDMNDLPHQFDHGLGSKEEELEDAWLSEEQEYEEYAAVGENYRPWYAGALWPVITVILVTLAVLLLVANFAVHLSKRRGRGPVLRAPMMLRPGLIDNKNCGLVYKPLQEEIPTPQMAKRGSFYSSSTFHYDKIVPESV